MQRVHEVKANNARAPRASKPIMHGLPAQFFVAGVCGKKWLPAQLLLLQVFVVRSGSQPSHAACNAQGF
jgi:hypothetical protein